MGECQELLMGSQLPFQSRISFESGKELLSFLFAEVAIEILNKQTIHRFTSFRESGIS
jgi:hypothetical protein